jgi:hypothetical protein
MSTSWPTTSERLLKFLLRYIGSVSLLSLVAVFMPYSWMDVTHQWLGMGKLPAEPVVGYLARSASLFYAMLGGLLWVCSFDLQRHLTVLRYLGMAFLFFGIVILGVDFVEGMPWFWKYVEGPMVILFGGLILAFTKGARTLSTDHGNAIGAE